MLKNNLAELYSGEIEFINVNFNDSFWEQSEEDEKRIEEIWETAFEKNEEENRKKLEGSKSVLYNGPLARVIKYDFFDGGLFFDTERTDYAHHVATRNNPNINERANPLYAGLLINLIDPRGDEYLVFGLTLGTEKHKVGQLNIVAGEVNPYTDRINGNLLPEETIRRELLEELGVSLNSSFSPIKPLFVANERIQQHPSIVYTGSLHMSMEELEHHHRRKYEIDIYENGTTPEFHNIYFVKNNPSAIRSEIMKNLFRNRVKVILSRYLD